MTIVQENIFHNVGQGLFYTSRLCLGRDVEITMVYDCGSFNSFYLSQAISKFSKSIKNKSLDILILSHLHYDHVSGLKQLLEKFKRKEIVILPYLHPIERLLLYFSITNPPEWYKKLLRNPIEFFKEEGFNLIFAIGDDNPPNGGIDGSPKVPYPPNEPIEFPEPKNKIFPIKDDKETNLVFMDKLKDFNVKSFSENIKNFLKAKGISKNIIDKFINILENDLENFGDNSFLKSHNGFQAVGKKKFKTRTLVIPIWFFGFFNYKKWEILVKLLKNKRFKSMLKNISSLWELLENSNYFDNLRKIYQDISKNLERMNNTSLITIHKVLNSQFFSLFLYDKINILKTFTQIFCFGESGLLNLMVINTQNAILLTGDIDFNYNYNSFKTHFDKRLLKEVKITQIPHHGSKHNWNDSILIDLPNCKYWVASAGCINRYEHPHLKVFEDIRNACRKPIWCNESNPIGFYIFNKEFPNFIRVLSV